MTAAEAAEAQAAAASLGISGGGVTLPSARPERFFSGTLGEATLPEPEVLVPPTPRVTLLRVAATRGRGAEGEEGASFGGLPVLPWHRRVRAPQSVPLAGAPMGHGAASASRGGHSRGGTPAAAPMVATAQQQAPLLQWSNGSATSPPAQASTCIRPARPASQLLCCGLPVPAGVGAATRSAASAVAADGGGRVLCALADGAVALVAPARSHGSVLLVA